MVAYLQLSSATPELVDLRYDNVLFIRLAMPNSLVSQAGPTHHSRREGASQHKRKPTKSLTPQDADEQTHLAGLP